MTGPAPHHPAVEALLGAYREGYFPMADPDRPGGPLLWFNPDPRAILPLSEAEGLHIPRRLRDRVRSGRFRITTDTAFGEVIRACADPRKDEPHSWIDPRIVSLYSALHEAGYAHSVEAWLPTSPLEGEVAAHRAAGGGSTPGHLVGGLYGVHIGSAFFAESKFSRPAHGGTDASKVCLVHLVAHLRRRGFSLLDVQFWNPHLEQFGCREIPRSAYLAQLAAAVETPCEWLPFESPAD
jgi:leucyl/phenylalanyl-tRNA--protein transferase